MHKNDYSIVVFFESQKPKKWNFVHKLNGFSKFLDGKHPTWLYINVYNRRNRAYLMRFYKGNIIPDFI